MYRHSPPNSEDKAQIHWKDNLFGAPNTTLIRHIFCYTGFIPVTAIIFEVLNATVGIHRRDFATHLRQVSILCIFLRGLFENVPLGSP